MTHTNEFRRVLLALALWTLPATMFGGTFFNGDFELPGNTSTLFLSTSVPGGDIANGIASSTFVTGWIHGGAIVNDPAQFDGYSLGSDYNIVPDSGQYYVTFGHNGFTGGTLSQTFDTVSGHDYLVTYWLLQQQGRDDIDLTQSMGLEAFDGIGTASLGAVQTLDFVARTWTAGSALSFRATSNSSTITFTDLTPNSGGVNWDLDTVNVTDATQGSAAPEPGSLVLLGAALLAIVGYRRRIG